MATRAPRRRRLSGRLAALAATGAAALLALSYVVIGRDNDQARGGPSPAQLAQPAPARVIARNGHPTNPTWHRDAQILELDDRVIVAWNGNVNVEAAELQTSNLAVARRMKVNAAPLTGASGEADPDASQHDTPTVFADALGRVHVLYGGASLAARGAAEDGPLERRAGVPGTLGRLQPERRLDIGTGSAYHFEAVRDGARTQHLFGQHGSGDIGSLWELRSSARGEWLPARKVIDGGFTRDACVFRGRPRGCPRYVTARVAAQPELDRLHMVWGYSEDSLAGQCRTDSRYCDNDLYYAYSDDRGATWRNGLGRAQVRIGAGPIDHDDRRFAVLRGRVAPIKALAVGPAGPLVIYGSSRKGGIDLFALRLTAGRWRRSLVVAAGEVGSRSWDGSLVLRSDPKAFTLWVPTGQRILRFSSESGTYWSRRTVYRGRAWSMTGVPARAPNQQLLAWRGKQTPDSSEVVVARMAVE